jgi:rhamnogalacturonyl hydrolase YesR
MNSKVDRGCYDEEEVLWFRDERFLADVAQTLNGKKVFWSRGNGWVLGGLARTLRTLPKAHKYYEEYRSVFVKTAASLRKCQSPDGFWRTSLLDSEEFDMPETSGTALNVLGMIIGIREGILDESYLECVWKGFDALTDIAMDENGRIGWVQVVALKPGIVRQEATNDYAVGTYLLICKELIAYIQEKKE